MALRFQLRQSPSVPLELEGILPSAFAGHSLDALRRAPIYHGNVRCELGELVEVSGGAIEGPWHFEGDWSRVHWLGCGLSTGQIVVHGSVGRHCGCTMSGGRIEVHGHAGDWLAAEMQGGMIQIHGNAGDCVASAQPGSIRGVNGGQILIDGDVGHQAGKSMRRGVLAIGGSSGELLAVGMLAGTIVVLGNVGRRCAAAMRRGTLVLAQPNPLPFLPTIRRSALCQPLVVRLILRHLQEAGFAIPQELSDAWFEMYHADLLEGGRGEIFVRSR